MAMVVQATKPTRVRGMEAWLGLVLSRVIMNPGLPSHVWFMTVGPESPFILQSALVWRIIHMACSGRFRGTKAGNQPLGAY